MEEILKQDKTGFRKEFETLLSEDLGNRKFKEGEIATATVEEIGKKFVFVDLGLKILPCGGGSVLVVTQREDTLPFLFV